MSKKEKIGALIADVNEAARGFVEKTKDSAVQIMDQNSDGHFDVEDLQVIKGNIGNAIKGGSNSIKEFVEEKSNEKELAKLNPIFVEDLTDTNFHLSKFLRILDRPEKYKNSLVCEGSIGFIAKDKDLPYHNIFKDSINEFSEKTFIPNDTSDFYYVDPVDSDMYIALDDYFDYLKSARISELSRIAQDLGAKHFTVTFLEEQSSFSDVDINLKENANAKGKLKARNSQLKESVSVSIDKKEKKYSTVKIEAQDDFPGSSPKEPKLNYFKNTPEIKALVDMRMHPSQSIKYHKYTLDFSKSSGLKEKDAVKIDAALKVLKLGGNASVASEARNELRKSLEYEIEF